MPQKYKHIKRSEKDWRKDIRCGKQEKNTGSHIRKCEISRPDITKPNESFQKE